MANRFGLLTIISDIPTAVMDAHKVIPIPCPIPVVTPKKRPDEVVLLITAARLGPGEIAPNMQISTICSQFIISNFYSNSRGKYLIKINTRLLNYLKFLYNTYIV